LFSNAAQKQQSTAFGDFVQTRASIRNVFKTVTENEMLDIKISGSGFLSRKEKIQKPVINPKLHI